MSASKGTGAVLKPLDIEVRQAAPDHCVVTVAGDLDVVTATELRHASNRPSRPTPAPSWTWRGFRSATAPA
ncbi:hypothetical protein [Streptomyces sp. 1222.5]|uniref:hypothetical protein n=1 Tax=Streptomyces sp. 1222.5 TaxID=1881026 RepID=UPI003D70677C